MDLLIPLELAVVSLIAYSAWKLAKLDGNTDRARQNGITRKLGNTPSSRLALWDARIWLYALYQPNHST